jgi:NitT/TauT family transport system substrate-binding protein
MKFLYTLASLIVIAACSNPSNTQDKTEKPLQIHKLNIGLLPSLDSFPYIVAQEEGFFEEEGLQIELTTFQSAMERDTAFQVGKIDGMASSDLITICLMRNAGIKAKAIRLGSGEKAGDGHIGIVVSPNSNIGTLDDLKGKAIAISPNTIIDYTTDKLLAANGFEPTNIQKSTVAKIAIRLAMLIENKISAGTFPEPYISLAILKGAKLLVSDKPYAFAQCVACFEESILEDRPLALQKLVRALNKAANQINTHPIEYSKKQIKYLGMALELEHSYVMPRYSVNAVPTKKQFNDVLEWLQDKKLLDIPLSYKDVITDEFLDNG